MVSGLSMAAMVVTLLCTLVLPVLVWIVYAVRKKEQKAGLAILLGAAGFFVMQIVVRVPVLNMLALSPSFQNFAASHYIWYCLALAFTAALFEVTARYVVARILSKRLTFENGMAAGLGHGGIEAILVVGMAYINNLLYSVMINSGAFDALMEQTTALGADITALVRAKEALIATAPPLFLLAGYERLLTILLQVALSLLVCYFVKQKKDWKGIGICLAVHTLVDFIAPFINGLATPYMGNVISTTAAYILVYVFLTGIAVLSAVVIRRIKEKWSEAV